MNSTEPSGEKAGGSANSSFRDGLRVDRGVQEEKGAGISEDDGLFDFARGTYGGDRDGADSFGLGDVGDHARRAAMAADDFGMRPGGRLSQRVGVVRVP